MTSKLFLLVALQVYGSLSKAVDQPADQIALNAVAGDVHKFSNELYEVTGKEVQGNFVSSPISVSAALSMLTYGAGGKTQNELKTALHFNNDENVQREGLQTLVENLNNSQTVDLRVANKIFVAKDFNIKSTFDEVTKSVFKSETQNVDYSNPQEASSTINQWTEKQTNSKVKDIVKTDDLDKDTALVLVNAVYFRASWAQEFNAAYTNSEPFYLEDGITTKNLSTMHTSRNCNYGVLTEANNASFIQLPYVDRNISMIIILPHKTSSLRDLESNLNKIPVSSFLSGRQHYVNIALPKFKIESKIELKEPLVKLGMKEMFEDSADLSGISDSELLKVDKIVQKAFIEVNEAGTEAAAVTTVHGVTFASLPPPADFHVNRPFYYAIVKRFGRQRDGVVLFHGRYNNVD